MSVRILGETTSFGREVLVGIPSPRIKTRQAFAVCVKVDDPEHLTLAKTYRIEITGKYASLKDDLGEMSVYPLDFFVEVKLSRDAKTRLVEALAA